MPKRLQRHVMFDWLSGGAGDAGCSQCYGVGNQPTVQAVRKELVLLSFIGRLDESC